MKVNVKKNGQNQKVQKAWAYHCPQNCLGKVWIKIVVNLHNAFGVLHISLTWIKWNCSILEWILYVGKFLSHMDWP